jgi:nucleotide-binding universal stress UspA family protein
MPSVIKSIVHPTDCSADCVIAFAHALRIALLAECRLDIVHVLTQENVDKDMVAPQVRQTLAFWGLADKADAPESIGERLNIKVSKIQFSAEDASSGVLDYVIQHPGDLLVFATHGRDGIDHWMHGSVAESVALQAVIPALFFPPNARGFVDGMSGDVLLHRVLMPVDHEPAPAHAFGAIAGFLNLFGDYDLELRLIHVGANAPSIRSRDKIEGMGAVELRSGRAIDAILKEADDWNADLIIMPTAGHSGLADAIHGSTSERVLRRAPCPVLTVPARH